ncbi:MAG TPA: hypothetical protein VN380_12825 [Thermoanaerobaculia bacterium]|jgi:hypothetical protein|nr:hypothetical protein [Thermoanaerobaculia bacterium]
MSDDHAGAKSFIEHIRTIHFALVIASAALWIALLASFEPRTTRKALEDCNRIQNLSEQLEWENWWTAYATAQWTNESSPFSNSARYASFDFPTYKRYWKIQFPSIVWTVHRAGRGAGAEPSITWDGTTIAVEPAPRTLTEFRKFWDRGRQPHVVAKPRQPEAVTIFAEAIEDDEKPFKVNLTLSREIVIPNLSARSAAEQGIPIANEPVAVTTYLLKLVDSADNSRRADYVLEVPRGMPPDFPLQTRNMRISASAVMDEYPSLTPVAWLCERYYPDWTPQQFDRAFAALLSVAPADTGNLPLGELSDHVRASIRLTKGDVDIAGLRVPSEALTWFAPLIILSLQLYLLLHVQVLSELSAKGDSLPLVAWVALFKSIIARGVFVVSAVLLPAAVLTFAVIRAILLQLAGLDITFQISGAVAAYILGAVLLKTMRVIWTKEAMQIAPAQASPARVDTEPDVGS